MPEKKPKKAAIKKREKYIHKSFETCIIHLTHQLNQRGIELLSCNALVSTCTATPRRLVLDPKKDRVFTCFELQERNAKQRDMYNRGYTYHTCQCTSVKLASIDVFLKIANKIYQISVLNQVSRFTKQFTEESLQTRDARKQI